jgi:hypothetical protein
MKENKRADFSLPRDFSRREFLELSAGAAG